MKSYIFRVVVEHDPKDDGTDGYHAYCPALQGCGTWGRTYEEAIRNINEAVLVYVEDMLDAGEPLPKELSDSQDVIVVNAPVVTVAA
jgi:predicted RNase H-like HicB family nuclease